MSTLTCNDQLGCYAMLKSLWIDGNDYISPFERMLVTLLQKRTITVIRSVDSLCAAFYDMWKIELPHMPMLHILGRLQTRGIIERPKHSSTYSVNFGKITVSDTIDEAKLSQLEDKFESIVNECLTFALTNFPQITSTQDQIRGELISFLSQQASDLAINGIKSTSVGKTSKNTYRVGKYIEHLQNNDKGKLQFLNDIAVGHILSRCIEIDKTSSGSLHGLTVYLDTGFIYSLLGIDLIDRRSVYENLVANLHQMGAVLKVFQHNIDEINYGLETALASKTSLYFRDTGASISDIVEIQTTYIATLKIRYHIDVDGGAYLPSQDAYNHDEKAIEEAIIKEYSASHEGIRPINSDNIALDAKSANKILRYREGISSPNLAECNYVFVTTNVSFAKSIKSYERTMRFADNCIAACITDSLIGTIVWLNQPARILEDSYARLVALAHAAFIPSEKTLSEFSKQLTAAKLKGTITPELCYHMRTAPTVRNILMDICAGNPSNVVESTPEEILKQIHDEGLEEGRTQTEVEYQSLLQNTKSANVQQMIAMYSQEIASLEENLRIIQPLISQQRSLQVAMKHKCDNRKRASIAGYIVIALMIIAGGIILSIYCNVVFGVITAMLPLIALFIGNIYFMLKEKSFSFSILFSAYMKRVEKRVCNLLAYCPTTLETLEAEESRLKDRVDLLKAAVDGVITNTSLT